MKKNILVQIGTRTETRTRVIPPTYDDEGNIVTEEHIEEYEEHVPIMESQNVDMTPEEIAEMELAEPTSDELIEQLKSELASTDYKAIKFAEGWLTDEEYAPIKAERESIRQKIRELEK